MFREVGVLHQQLNIIIRQHWPSSLTSLVQQSRLPLQSRLKYQLHRFHRPRYIDKHIPWLKIVSLNTFRKFPKNPYYSLLRHPLPPLTALFEKIVIMVVQSREYTTRTVLFSPEYRRRSWTVWPASWTFPSRWSLLSNTRTWCSPQRSCHCPLRPPHCPLGSSSPPRWFSSSQYFPIFSLFSKIYLVSFTSAGLYILNKCN